MKVTYSLFSALALTTQSTAQSVAPKDPKPPDITYLYSSNFTGGEGYQIGNGPQGFRYVRPTTGGTFEGPKLKGTVLPVGGEFGLLDASHPNGSFYVDLRQTLRTDDDVLIQIFVTGPSQPNGVDYLNVRFETGSDKYYWLNTVLAFGVLGLSEDVLSAAYDVWMLNTPKASGTP